MEGILGTWVRLPEQTLVHNINIPRRNTVMRHRHPRSDLPPPPLRTQSCRRRPKRNSTLPSRLHLNLHLRNLHRRRLPPRLRRPQGLHRCPHRRHLLDDLDPPPQCARRLPAPRRRHAAQSRPDHWQCWRHLHWRRLHRTRHGLLMDRLLGQQPQLSQQPQLRPVHHIPPLSARVSVSVLRPRIRPRPPRPRRAETDALPRGRHAPIRGGPDLRFRRESAHLQRHEWEDQRRVFRDTVYIV